MFHKPFKVKNCPKCSNPMRPGIMMENIEHKVIPESWLDINFVNPNIFKEAQDVNCVPIIGFACKACGFTEQYLDTPDLYEHVDA